jgi:hypothetical protein
MSDDIEMVVALGDQMTEEDMQLIFDAYILRGADDGRYAWRAARAAGRESQVAAAAGALSKEIEINGFDRDRGLVTITSRAAFDLGVAIATRDLIGTEFYGISDYERLLYPWRAAFPEVGR